jgi:hypothetical protein
MAVSFTSSLLGGCLLAFPDFYIQQGNDFVGTFNKCFTNAVMDDCPIFFPLTTST